MINSIIVFMKDGSKKEFQHEGRAGGSYSMTIKYENGFAIITDEWDSETVIPSQDIKEIKIEKFHRP